MCVCGGGGLIGAGCIVCCRSTLVSYVPWCIEMRLRVTPNTLTPHTLPLSPQSAPHTPAAGTEGGGATLTAMTFKESRPPPLTTVSGRHSRLLRPGYLGGGGGGGGGGYRSEPRTVGNRSYPQGKPHTPHPTRGVGGGGWFTDPLPGNRPSAN